MEYQQLIQPNLSIIGQNGDCLVYVRDVFEIAAKYLTATIAWQNTQYPHAGEQPPSNNAVPIWFSLTSNADGHVAVWDKGTIYTTTAQGDMTFNNIQALMDYINEGIVYLGWSEDIDNVRVVEEEIVETFNAGDAVNYSEAYFGTATPPDFVSAQVGLDWKTAMYNIMTETNLQQYIQVNAGDVGNINNAMGSSIPDVELVGTTWKGAWYDVISQNLPASNTALQSQINQIKAIVD